MKTKNIFLTLALALCTTFAFAQVKVSESGSPHNLVSELVSTEICNVCHTPHNATSTLLPLWSRAGTTQTFALYTSTTLDGTYVDASGNDVVGANSTIGGASGLCLSCHDGVTKMDAYHNGPTTPSITMGALQGNLGTTFTNDHPISIKYVDGGTTQMVAAATVVLADANYLYETATAGTYTVECASCHSLHSGVADSKLLRSTNLGSALCLTCHAK